MIGGVFRKWNMCRNNSRNTGCMIPARCPLRRGFSELHPALRFAETPLKQGLFSSFSSIHAGRRIFPSSRCHGLASRLLWGNSTVLDGPMSGRVTEPENKTHPIRNDMKTKLMPILSILLVFLGLVASLAQAHGKSPRCEDQAHRHQGVSGIQGHREIPLPFRRTRVPGRGGDIATSRRRRVDRGGGFRSRGRHDH